MKARAALALALLLAPAAPAAAAGLCVTNAYEVAWVHPGIVFYAGPDAYACEGPSLRVREGETGCFDGDEAPAGAPTFLAGEHAVTGACVPVCETREPSVTVVFDLAATYACAP